MTRIPLSDFLGGGAVVATSPKRMKLEDFLAGGAPAPPATPPAPAPLSVPFVNQPTIVPPLADILQGGGNADWDVPSGPLGRGIDPYSQNPYDFMQSQYGNVPQGQSVAGAIPEVENFLGGYDLGAGPRDNGDLTFDGQQLPKSALTPTSISDFNERKRAEEQRIAEQERLATEQAFLPNADPSWEGMQRRAKYYETLPYKITADIQSDPVMFAKYRRLNELATGQPLLDVPPEKRAAAQQAIDDTLADMEANGIDDPLRYVQQLESFLGPQSFAGRNASTMWESTKRTGANVFDALTDLAGNDTLGTRQRQMEAAWQEGLEDIKDERSLPYAPDWLRNPANEVARAASQSAPQLAAAAGAGAINPGLGWATLLGPSGVENFQVGRANGLSNAVSAGRAVALAGVEYATAKVGGAIAGSFGGKTFEEVAFGTGAKASQRGLLGKLSEALGGSVIEGGEEVAAGVAQQIADHLVGLEEELVGDETPEQLALAFAVGMVASGAMHIPAFAQFVQNPTAKNAKAAGITTELAPTQADRESLAAAAAEKMTGQDQAGAEFARQAWAEVNGEPVAEVAGPVAEIPPEVAPAGENTQIPVTEPVTEQLPPPAEAQPRKRRIGDRKQEPPVAEQAPAKPTQPKKRIGDRKTSPQESGQTQWQKPSGTSHPKADIPLTKMEQRAQEDKAKTNARIRREGRGDTADAGRGWIADAWRRRPEWVKTPADAAEWIEGPRGGFDIGPYYKYLDQTKFTLEQAFANYRDQELERFQAEQPTAPPAEAQPEAQNPPATAEPTVTKSPSVAPPDAPSVAPSQAQADSGVAKETTEQVEETPPSSDADQYVQRYEEPGVGRAGFDKPHGIYTSPADQESPHADLGGDRFLWKKNPEANVLSIDETKSGADIAIRRGAISAGAGVHAYRQLAGEDAFQEIKRMGKKQAAAFVADLDPSVDFTKYFDTQEIIEAAGAILARKAGYDAIELKGNEPKWNEFVGLTEKSMTPVDGGGTATTEPATTTPAQPESPAPTDAEPKKKTVGKKKPAAEDAELTKAQSLVNEAMPKSGGKVVRTDDGLRIQFPNGKSTAFKFVDEVPATDAEVVRALKNYEIEDTPENRAQFRANIRGRFQLGGKDVHGVIYLRTGLGQNASAVLRHELVHFAKENGAWTDQEWNDLVAEVAPQTIGKSQKVQEEAVARALQEPTIANKLRDFIDSILEAMGVNVDAIKSLSAQARSGDVLAKKKLGQKSDSERPALFSRDTRGQGTQYHGTSAPSLSPTNDHYSTLNYYGQGFYTTDAIDIAYGYSKRGSKQSGKRGVWKIEEKRPLNIYDAEQPISPDVLAMLEDVAEAQGVVGDAIDQKPANLRELYDDIRDNSKENGLSADTVQETFDTLAYRLQQMGYDGIQHKGGLLTGAKEHLVKVYFNPESDITVSEVVPTEAPPLPTIAEAEKATGVKSADATKRQTRPVASAIPNDIQVEVEAIKAKTGERVKVKKNARDAYVELDKDAKLYKKLIYCLEH